MGRIWCLSRPPESPPSSCIGPLESRFGVRAHRIRVKVGQVEGRDWWASIQPLLDIMLLGGGGQIIAGAFFGALFQLDVNGFYYF